MAAYHVRSSSFPSRSHRVAAAMEEQLYKFKALQSSSPCQKLGGLKDLYECVDDLLQLPLTRETLSNDRQSECVEEVLNGSLKLLDMCGTTRDLLSQIKDCVQEFHLSLRRRRGRESSLENEVDAYMASRKKLNKVISKCLRNLKKNEKNLPKANLDNNSNLATVITVLRGVEAISLAMFESILAFISLPKRETNPSRWSIVSKLLKSKSVSCEGEVYANEAEKIDAELLVLRSRTAISSVQVQNLLKGLEGLESSIQEIEEELECVYRQLVKTRVLLLNSLNH